MSSPWRSFLLDQRRTPLPGLTVRIRDAAAAPARPDPGRHRRHFRLVLERVGRPGSSGTELGSCTLVRDGDLLLLERVDLAPGPCRPILQDLLLDAVREVAERLGLRRVHLPVELLPTLRAG